MDKKPDKKPEATKKEEDRPVAPQEEDLFEDFALEDGEHHPLPNSIKQPRDDLYMLFAYT